VATADETIQAAGGVIVRSGSGGEPELVVIHRPRYRDWSLPKGKLDPGETHEEAALREVDEETGFRCRLLEELSAVRYTDRHGRPKIVRYWLMEHEGGEFRPNREVDEVRWVASDEAERLLTHDRDRELVAEALRRV
jgi:8-oxo-dGTP diphosphatase